MADAIVHCHFYQPPREDPWLDVVEAEPSAAPFHDWNARITHQCYEPFGAARLLDAAGHVVRRINLYEWVSFDVGTTLARWLELNATDTYEAILAADRASAARLGHGNAIAAPYHHVILPLASPRDRATEIRWGIDDFRRRFQREPEGFWLPETAVDEQTLVALAEAGIKFTILAPHQVEHVPPGGAPLKFSAGGGRTIALFIYDGGLSHDVAFGRVLDDGTELARRLGPDRASVANKGAGASLRAIALDGETFGHHKQFAEMALARAVSELTTRGDVCIENFGSALARNAATAAGEAILVEESSWSCSHGVERWRSNCSCGMDAKPSHEWRRPLRSALNWLARQLDDRYAEQAALLGGVGGDPWKIRDGYGAVAALSLDERRAYVESIADKANIDGAVSLFDGVRARLGMFGSCAWFFDRATGHETELMLRLAAFAIGAIAGDDSALEREFIERLAFAKDGMPGGGDAATVYRTRVMPLREGGAHAR
ncbi:MAG TPA: DUF3536 domain-containing protein [Gemmatimonadaceae bacterium]|jgi:hypothetical protein|nr:DUF3536 domain-containing protein [Gemmatimonadaceae bacterium]